MARNETRREPLFHITARAPMPWYRALLVRAACIVGALVLCVLLAWLVTGVDPIQFAVAVFRASFPEKASMFKIKFWQMLRDLAILLLLALAVTPAFRMRFWNIGAEGQTLMGCLSTVACMKLLAGVIPHEWIIVCEVAAALLAGAIWGVIPAIFKAKFGTNETLFTLMMNYIATQLVAFFCVVWENPKGSGTTGIINQSGPLRGAGWLPVIAGNKQLLTVIVAGVMTLVMFFYLYKSKHGFELSVVGESRRTASYLGISVGKVTVRTMILSGALCGLTGLLLAAGENHNLTVTQAGGRGFTAVMVSWLAKFNPFVMILASFLLVFMEKGASEVAKRFSLNESFSEILTGIILFFIIGSDFFIRYRIRLRHRAAVERGGLTDV